MKNKIDQECLNIGYPKCSLIKYEIDKVLHLNSADRAELGIDTTKEEKEQVKIIERSRLLSVRHLDKDFVDGLLNADE